MARRVPYLAEYTAVASAAALVAGFVCPVLTEVSNSLTWNPEALDRE